MNGGLWVALVAGLMYVGLMAAEIQTEKTDFQAVVEAQAQAQAQHIRGLEKQAERADRLCGVRS